jgi:hypothetical protein
MSNTEVRILNAARAWALALAGLEETRASQRAEADGFDCAELAIYSAAARVEALRAAERALYRAVEPTVQIPR